MRIFLIAMLAIVSCAVTAQASESRLLKTGDIIKIENGDTLSVPELRVALREFGYSRLGTGGRYGRTLVITAWGPDNNRYELKVNSRSGKVIRAWIMRRGS